MTGIVQFYDALRGIGYIKPKGMSHVVCVLSSSITGTINKNDRVRFSLSGTGKDFLAIDVVLLPHLTGKII